MSLKKIINKKVLKKLKPTDFVEVGWEFAINGKKSATKKALKKAGYRKLKWFL